jgi:RND superfamily putative drug exporter
MQTLARSFFDSLNAFIRKWYRLIIIAWIVAVLLSAVIVPRFFSSVSYDLTSGLGAPSNTESAKAADILKTQFPSSSNSSGDNVLIVLQNAPVFSDQLKQILLALNDTLSKDQNIDDYTDTTSLYSLEASLLNSSLPEIVVQVAGLQSNIATINSGLYTMQDNLTVLSVNLFQLQAGINQTAQLVYGVPAAFVGAWQEITAQGIIDPYSANNLANTTTYSLTNNFGGDPQTIGYYSAFFGAWSASFQTLPHNTTVIDREAFAVNQSVIALLSSGQIDAQTSQIMAMVALDLTPTSWNQPQAIANLTVSTIASSIPEELSAALGTSPTSVVTQLYVFGSTPSNETLANYAIALLENSYSNISTADTGFSVSDLMQSSYQLGTSPNNVQTWVLACNLISNATQSTFVGSPLFNVNATALSNLLSALPPNATTNDINQVIDNTISTQQYINYPYIPTSALTSNFVDSNNNTMLIILGFSHDLDTATIARVESDIKNSGLENFGTVYVTGATVLTKDIQKAFLPALEITLGPGIAVSLLIVGLLFLAPVAALIPVLLGGVSVSVALGSIYLAVVEIGQGTISFLTPTLTILLMLGLAVDYAVLQLRRTREERQKGKSLEESVGISIKWAGQAVLTAGITVIVAYVIMAVANVPIFSDVGTAIALGVSILLVASLTLLPALEIALGDRIFWPSLKMSQEQDPSKNLLKRLAKKTLKRKVPIILLISVLALGALFVTIDTPLSDDFLRLIPNFQSNQGLTVLSNNFGSGAISPTTIVVTMPTQITYGNNQFNQTLLNQIELITATAANSEGVISVSSPTRPFGNTFNYSGIDSMPVTLSSQYESQMFSDIGADNKTAVIKVGFSDSAASQAAIDSLRAMQSNINKLTLASGVTIHFDGQTQSTYDSQTFMANLIPEVVVILSVAVYVILFFQLRSAFTPIRLIVTILSSVVMALAIIALIFYIGANLPILNFAPLFVVVTMLGVGIDYDIFFVTRIREEALNGKTDNEAITTAIEKVWVTIFCLGLVLATVFASLLITNIAILQEISLAVTAAILIDVSVVILFFVPSLMGLAQKFNWWPYKISRNQQQQGNIELDSKKDKAKK